MQLTTAISIIFLNMVLHNVMAQPYFQNDFPGVWQRATNYTMEVAKAMPAEKYSFKAKEESMTFHEHLVHIIHNLSSLSSRISGDRKDFFHGKDPGLLTKEQLAEVLQDTFKYISKLIEDTDEKILLESIEFRGQTMTKENIFYLMRDHITHHRAQIILYLRLNNIDAPVYRGW